MTDSALRRRTRRAFSAWLIAISFAVLAWVLIWAQIQDGGIPSALRRGLELNRILWSGVFSVGRENTVTPPEPGRPLRVNGDVGLDVVDFDPATWSVSVDSSTPDQSLRLRLSDLQWAPLTETSAEFRCIEGWSEPISYGGVRFSEFLRRFNLGRRSGQPWDSAGAVPDDLYRYVAMETPDGEYYVSIDMESMLHPQTLLAWQMNGMSLSLENGAPLRLIIPVKYGIKSLKRIGRISFSDERPRDYWAERGYDWFAGL